jgi:gentisate 1,2-dioxygenase
MREDVIGRANVEDTDELLAYYKELEQHDAAALWTVANKIEPWQPQSVSVPVFWKYRDRCEHVMRSVQLVSPEKSGRRVIYLNSEDACLFSLDDLPVIEGLGLYREEAFGDNAGHQAVAA